MSRTKLDSPFSILTFPQNKSCFHWKPPPRMAPKAKNGIRDFKTHIPFLLTVQLNFTPSTTQVRNLF